MRSWNMGRLRALSTFRPPASTAWTASRDGAVGRPASAPSLQETGAGHPGRGRNEADPATRGALRFRRRCPQKPAVAATPETGRRTGFATSPLRRLRRMRTDGRCICISARFEVQTAPCSVAGIAKFPRAPGTPCAVPTKPPSGIHSRKAFRPPTNAATDPLPPPTNATIEATKGEKTCAQRLWRCRAWHPN